LSKEALVVFGTGFDKLGPNGHVILDELGD